MIFYIVDAFSDKPFGGNQAGVVLYESLDDNTFQSIAKELRFSETAFVKSIGSNNFSIRYFTPNSEVDLCGHATIASIGVLKELGLINENIKCIIHTKAGALQVYIDGSTIMMEQGEPSLSNTIDSIDEIADIMGILKSQIGDIKYNLTPQISSTGLRDIMLPVKSISILKSIKPDFKRLSEYSAKNNVVGVHAFTLEGDKFTACCRNFAPLYEIDEEAATGTSNGALTYYLYKNGVIGELNRSYNFLQGVEMKRPSIITTRIIEDRGIRILVGGVYYILSKGELLI